MTVNLFSEISDLKVACVCVEPDEVYRVIDKGKVGDLIKFVLGYDCCHHGAFICLFHYLFAGFPAAFTVTYAVKLAAG